MYVIVNGIWQVFIIFTTVRATAYLAMPLSSLSKGWDEAGISTVTEEVAVVCGGAGSVDVSVTLRRVSPSVASTGVVKGKVALLEVAAGAEETPLGVINCRGTCPCSSS
jgi:hypothetical protein